MQIVFASLLAFILGVFVSYLFLSRKYSSLEAENRHLSSSLEEIKKHKDELEERLLKEKEEKAALKTKLEANEKLLQEERRILQEAEEALKDAFKALSADILKDNSYMFADIAKKTIEALFVEAKGDLEKRQQAIEQVLSPISEALSKFEDRIKDLEMKRETAYRSIKEEIEKLSKRSEELRISAEKLASALRNPKIKGRWGEVALKNLVELSGLSDYCDFSEQSFLQTDEGYYKPDMVIRLPGGRFIVVDAKTPVDYYLEALEAEGESEKKKLLQKHAKSVKSHVKRLSDKSYWKKVGRSPDFVIMFMPAEAFFSAALEADRDLIEEAMRNGVIIATPTILVALLKVIALSWKEYILSENVRHLVDVGKELSDRINKFLSHFVSLGKRLEGAVKSYNDAIGSWHRRVEPTFRRFSQLCGVSKETELESLNVSVRGVLEDNKDEKTGEES